MLTRSASPLLRTLLLEDRPDDAELVLIELQRSGFQVVWERVDNEQDYLQRLNNDYDIILADYSLPQFSAPRALSILQEKNLDIPFIVVTGSISEEVAVECIKQGATDYLIKDRLSRLGPAVSLALHEKRLRDEKRLTEEALRQSEEKFKTIVDESLDVILVVDPETGRISDANRAAWRALFYRPEILMGQSFSVLFPDDAPQSHETIFESVRMAGVVYLSQKFRRADSSAVLMDLTANSIPWENGVAILVTLRDASERERADAEYQRAQTFRLQFEKERELNELKSRFVSMVTHEFRTPLTAIELTVSILEGYYDRLDDMQRAKRFKTIHTQVEHMTALMTDALTISRAEAGALKFEPVTLNLDLFCHDIVEEFQIAHEGRYTIVYNATGDLSQFKADEKLLRHIVVNLVSNAIKYSPEGGSVYVDLAADAQQAVLTVRDTGIGIPAEDQPMLFKTFHRAANVGAIPGSGLGLSITKHSVDAHGGSIAFLSRSGEGTTFIVTLPREPKSPA